jgi:hypothetical protein
MSAILLAIHGVVNPQPEVLQRRLKLVSPRVGWLADIQVEKFNWNKLVTPAHVKGVLQTGPLTDLSRCALLSIRWTPTSSLPRIALAP